jgi:ABC-type Mn2+/Zn2+ transport system ATPase subunit
MERPPVLVIAPLPQLDERPDDPPAARDEILVVRDLTVTYNREPALEAVSFSIYAGERVAIIGPNGAGKSTLIKAIMGLLQPQAGTISIHGDRRDCLGYVPQHEGVNWDFPATAREVVMMGRARHIGWLRRAGRDHWRQVDEALDRVGMADLRHRQIGDLSGGQRRRVFIARALAQEARILLLDEPFSGVDASAQAGMMAVLDDLNRAGITLLLSTHDLGLAFQRFARVMALRRSLIAYGPPEAVYTPDVLARLYGGQLATWQAGQPVLVFVDDHHCADC